MMVSISQLFRKGILSITLLFPPFLARAQHSTSISGNLEIFLAILIVLLSILLIIILIVILYILNLMKTLLLKETRKAPSEKAAENFRSLVFGNILNNLLIRSTPISQEADILMDHNYDGIKELDNHLPPWWKALFYITMIWGALYLMVYHVLHWMPLSDEEFTQEIAQADRESEIRMLGTGHVIDENTVESTEDPLLLANGASIFKTHCVVCHADDGGGGVGPNMTDAYWIHGGSIKNLFWVIKNGVPAKGMISWENQLSPEDIRDVASYILTLQGTSPVNPKAAQGELYIDTVEVENPGSALTDDRPGIESVVDSLDNVEIGRGLFSGSIRFSEGGPACITCHNVTEEILPKGALIAPDLTNVYTRLDQPTLYKVITKPYHLTMQEAFQGRGLMESEVDYLVAYFEFVGTSTDHQRQRDERAAGFLDRIRKQ